MKTAAELTKIWIMNETIFFWKLAINTEFGMCVAVAASFDIGPCVFSSQTQVDVVAVQLKRPTHRVSTDFFLILAFLHCCSVKWAIFGWKFVFKWSFKVAFSIIVECYKLVHLNSARYHKLYIRVQLNFRAYNAIVIRHKLDCSV